VAKGAIKLNMFTSGDERDFHDRGGGIKQYLTPLSLRVPPPRQVFDVNSALRLHPRPTRPPAPFFCCLMLFGHSRAE